MVGCFTHRTTPIATLSFALMGPQFNLDRGTRPSYGQSRHSVDTAGWKTVDFLQTLTWQYLVLVEGACLWPSHCHPPVLNTKIPLR